ncbi:LacI family DNA-binding transcriptional regulator [Pseudomonas oryzihabitans]|uniref:LacI family DNA-binding transcriptional regulator n=1 Tax=Pseudomonas oryzihabitans TaxID=47885 RepID=UPI00135D3D5C|nr:LacI family DNA-binding transcriptional regulator [Pseudomonas oryzihabitans]MXS20500.1 substrate-binding domain-containing protein [Pseudomonas oryzihabitans]
MNDVFIPGPRATRATIAEVAAVAGVSKASVSRYISGDRRLLSDALATRIEQAVVALDFQPNQMARGLKRGRSRLIGMLVADLLNPYSTAVMHGVETACRQQGYSLLICNTDQDARQERQQLAALQSYSIEGLIVNTFGQHAADLQHLGSRLPLVLLDRELPGVEADLVGLDNHQAIATGVAHLQSQGYRDLLLISEPLDGTSSRRQRLTAFDAALAAHPGCRGGHCAEADDALALQTALAAFLASPGPGPKALLTANGVATLTTTLALQALGEPLFERLGLLALDDLDWFPLVGGGISALAQPTHALGVAAFERLQRRIDGDRSAPVQQTFGAELRVRQSTRARA